MIHCFCYNGRYFVIDVESGSVHELDALCFELLSAMERGEDISSLSCGEAEKAEALSEIEELKNAGLLFTEAADRLPSGAQTVIKALCLHIAHDCNLRCAYCFGGTGSFHGKRELMSAKTARAAIDFLLRSSGARRHLEVDFFGGEPTMNFDVVRDCVEYGRAREKEYGKEIAFTLTTNAYDVTDEMIAFMDANMKNIVVSLDGRREIHDAMRKNAAGEGSYDRCVANAKRIVAARGDKEHYIRGTFTRRNLDFVADIQALYDCGFKNISIEPVVTKGPSGITEEDVPAIKAEYERLSDWLLRHPDVVFFHFMVDLDSGPCILKRIRGCGAGSEYAAVAPSGDIFPCHQFVGQRDFLMGNVETGLLPTDIAERFCAVNVYKKPSCKRCWARYYCSGGCAANAYNLFGDIAADCPVTCELSKKRIEIAVAKAVGQ